MSEPWPLPHATVRTDLRGWDRWHWDLQWHRENWEQSRMKWGPENVTDIISAYTNGRLEFTTARDLSYLARVAININAHADLLLVNIYPHLARALREAPAPDNGGDPATTLAQAWCIDEGHGVLTCIRDHPHTERNNHSDYVLDGLGPRANPLIAGWELLQHWHMWDSAHQLALNTHALLTWELIDNPKRVRKNETQLIDKALDFHWHWSIRGRPEPIPIPTQTYHISYLF